MVLLSLSVLTDHFLWRMGSTIASIIVLSLLITILLSSHWRKPWLIHCLIHNNLLFELLLVRYNPSQFIVSLNLLLWGNHTSGHILSLMYFLDRCIIRAESWHFVLLERWGFLVHYNLLSLLTQHTDISVVLLVNVRIADSINLGSISNYFGILISRHHLRLGGVLKVLVISRVIGAKSWECWKITLPRKPRHIWNIRPFAHLVKIPLHLFLRGLAPHRRLLACFALRRMILADSPALWLLLRENLLFG